ncbi:sigma-54 dependent transcriptional regulator [Plesiomonas shigelloides]|uniref:sigma-54 interaction domain-containing protein n=1 Tax=Plesiomonas shigelloides TaxID=703 RepID=UPI002246E9F1|nr:sigma-54 dependent transcriptional regulator [Plesiomonas shigelloides]MCX2534864.1 sigma-54 dependent transcriptional regulator [Plesiomonas shigelloides]
MAISYCISAIESELEKVAKTDATVLLLGETGVGKEVAARKIHNLSSRSKSLFVEVNCGAIPTELLESELFGYEKGAFTGAINSKKGKFELANNGTIFLDEIGDLPLLMQVKILRVLQDKCISRLGSERSVKINVRVISATHRDLDQMVLLGTFRMDLYYRLSLFPITIPPLREMRNKFNIILDDIVTRKSKHYNADIKFQHDAIEVLSNYSWPGNIRELSNLVERLLIMFPNSCIGMDNLPDKILLSKKESSQVVSCNEIVDLNYNGESIKESSTAHALIDEEIDVTSNNKIIYGVSLNGRLAINSVEFDIFIDDSKTCDNLKGYKKITTEFEKSLIISALFMANGVVSSAARMLKIQRTTLIEKIKRFSIDYNLKQ